MFSIALKNFLLCTLIIVILHFIVKNFIQSMTPTTVHNEEVQNDAEVQNVEEEPGEIDNDTEEFVQEEENELDAMFKEDDAIERDETPKPVDNSAFVLPYDTDASAFASI